jgi:Rrf2 family protein
MLTQKCQYALKAIFELGRYFEKGPVKIGRIAKTQEIPARFLEVILNELKQGGFVASRRGNDGGYFLLKDPQQLTVGEIIRFVDGPLGPVRPPESPSHSRLELVSDHVFQHLWERANDALSDIYDATTFFDLLEEDGRMRRHVALNYAI